MASKLTEGEYTVSVAQKDADALKGSVKVENEKVASIEVLSDVAPFTSNAKNAATVGVQVLNQYGEDITKLNYTDITVTVAGAAATGSLTSNGTLNLTNLSPIAKEGDNVILTLVHGKTGVAKQATVKLSAQSAISEIAFGELYNKDGKTLTQDTDLAKDKFYLPVSTKDQYGSVVDNVTTINTEILFTNTNPGVATFSPVKTVTINGKDANVVEVTGVNLDGTANLIAVATKTGKSAQTAVKVAEGVKISSVALSSPTQVVSANKDVYFPLTVVDTAGKEIKTEKELAAIKKDSVSTSTGSSIVEVEGKEGLFVKVAKGSVIENQAVTVVVTTQSGKVATQSVVVKAEAVPTVITGLASNVPTALRAKDANGVTIKNTNLVVEDQYGQVITDKAVLGAITFTATADPANSATVTITDPDADKKSAKIVATPNTTEKSSKVNFKLFKNGANVEASTLTKTFKVVSDNQFESYSVEDVPTIYADATNDNKVVAAYNQDIEVTAKTASGDLVTLDEGVDFTVNGKTAAGSEVKFADKATTATEKVTITINATGEVLTKEITYSNVAPKVEKVQLVKNDSVVEDSSGTAGKAKEITSSTKIEEVNAVTFAGGKAFNIAELSKLVDFVVTDSYGQTVAADEQSGLVIKLADGKTIATQTLTLSKVSGDVTFANNGLINAAASEFTAGAEFNSLFKLAGVSGNTVKVTATAKHTPTQDAADAANAANASIATARNLVVDTNTAAETNLLTQLNGLSGMAATGVTLAVKAPVTGPSEVATAKVAANGDITKGTTQQVLNVTITIAKANGTTVEKTIAVTIPAL